VKHTPSVPSSADLIVLSEVIRHVSRSSRLSSADAEDFAQSVHLRLVERQYDVFRRFKGRSSIRTYLTVVVTRMLLDWRNAMYGKWRPSAAAVRLGAHAILLERLISREGYTMDEAAEIAQARTTISADDLRRMAGDLPPRRRRRPVSDDVLQQLAGCGFEDPIQSHEERREMQQIGHALAKALRQLPEEDRLLIRLRYGGRRSVQALARMLKVDAKTLYRRFDQMLRLLRRVLTDAGVTGPNAFARQTIRPRMAPFER
jgi:RNA polymerase sigma factor for flagellar operon FliA